MESYKELVCAIHEVQKAVDSILRAIDEGHRPDWAELFHRKGLADTRYELEGLGDVLNGSLPVLSVMIFAWLAYPPIIVDTYGVFRLPYAKFITLIFGA